jgi:hypothetical protein
MKFCSWFNAAGLGICAVLLGTLTGCASHGSWSRTWDVPPPMADKGFAVKDDYVYYPQYECYYSLTRHLYANRDGRDWISHPNPSGVSVNALLDSPSVIMNFHDSPALHNADVVRQYPKDWKPSGGNLSQNR